jgi:hypothetical protein
MRIRLLTVGLVLSAVVLGGMLLRGDGSSTQDLNLEGISKEELRAAGVTLQLATANDRASLDAEQATEIALERGHGPEVKVREVVLARMSGGGRNDGKLVWVINFEPDTVQPFPLLAGPAGSDPGERRIAFLLEYVDAETGEFLGGHERGAEPLSTD